MLFSCQNTIVNPHELDKYMETIKNSGKPSKEYILELFKNHEIVVICERFHAETTQYDLIKEIISDPYFIDSVGNVFCEIGAENYQKQVDSFLFANYNSIDDAKTEALEIQRSISFYPLWSVYNYHRFLMDLYFINHRLPKEKKIKLFISDRAFSWDKILTRKEYLSFFDDENIRDSIIASNIIHNYSKLSEVDSIKPLKALIILNSVHAFTNIYWTKPELNISNCAGRYLKQYFNNRIANVLLNTTIDSKKALPIQNGKWDAAFKKLNNPNIGFDFKDTPFGYDQFDYYTDISHNLTYQDVFTGYVFYQPLEKQTMQWGVPGLIDADFYPEIKRRLKIDSKFPFFYKNYNKATIERHENIKRITKEINKYY